MIEILIVEDEKPISDLIRLNLMKAGYSCTCAFDGMEAADILEERNFDLIILDVMLPKLNGFELMEYIKPLLFNRPSFGNIRSRTTVTASTWIWRFRASDGTATWQALERWLWASIWSKICKARICENRT